MDVNIVRSGQIFQYNPATEGYSANDVFTPLTGTPTISSDKLRLNAAEVLTYDKRFQFGNLEFLLTIPAAPTAGDVRSFGFKNNDNKGMMVFDITGAVFSAKVYDSKGTLIATKTINWDSDWTAAEAQYRIAWNNRNIYFLVDDVFVARFDEGFDKDIVAEDIMGSQPMGIYINNGNADNVDVSLINYV